MAKKRKAKPKTDSPTIESSPGPANRMSLSVRQIKNGYLVNKHGSKDGKYFDEEFYTPNAPQITAATPKQAKAREGRLMKVKL
jgi:hypothetical protein